MPNHVVASELNKCDFVIDQAYSDYPLPALATEAAWFGKPVIIGGYAHDKWNEWLPEENIPPVHYCHPDSLEASVRKLIVDKQYRLDLGRKARAFVEEYSSPRKVAERYKKIITGNVPDSWFYDPYRIRYINGYGLHETGLKRIISRMLQVGGLGSLQLEDKPELEKMFRDLVSNSQTEVDEA